MALMDRTLYNLSVIDRQKTQDGPYEVTQVILSFLTVIAFPREQFLETKKLKWILLDEDIVTQQFEFPSMESSSEFDTERPNTLDHLTRLLRNATAHGNIEILDKPTLLQRRPSAEALIPANSLESDIAGIEIWNEDSGDRRTWGTILTEQEMRQLLRAMSLLARDDRFRKKPDENINGGRPKPRHAELIGWGQGPKIADREKAEKRAEHERKMAQKRAAQVSATT